MDIAEQATTPAFMRLSTELLEMIVDYAVSSGPGFWRIRYAVMQKRASWNGF